MDGAGPPGGVDGSLSKSFEGQRTLAKHKLVLGAIAHLMQGDGAPVHAVDRIDARAE